jgi:photosystem II stability/assembly factor-like uncharacterized protein
MNSRILVVLGLAALSMRARFPDVTYDPLIDELIQSVSSDSVSGVIAGISGEVAVTIDGEPDSISTRYAYSQGSYRAALWLSERLEAAGLDAELVPFIPLELRDVDLLASGEGWACGWNGHGWTGHGQGVLHTQDAGASWEVVTSIEGFAWQSLAAVSADSLWIAGSDGRIVGTTDGLSWDTMRPEGTGLYDIFMLDSHRGWAIGDSGAFLSTIDAWENYTEEQVVPENLKHIFFISETHGWIASDSSLWKTADGGGNWEYLANPMVEITGFEFIDSLRGYLIGDRGYSTSAVYYTLDAGLTWEPRLDTQGNVLRSIKVAGADTLWVGGDGGVIGFSPNGGSDWFFKNTPSRARIEAMDASADGRWAAVGAEEIFYSPDGVSWFRADTANLGLMWNVVATLPGQSPECPMVLITAHYDARSEDNEHYTPGADDNGSGVAAVMECARVLSQHSWQNNIKFVLFGGEEVGLFGSHRFVTEAVGAYDYGHILAVLNADMFAYDGNGDGAVEVNSNPEDALAQAAGKVLMDVIDVYDIDLEPTHHIADAKYNSDHYYFWLNRVPAVFLGEDRNDLNPFYHTTGDRLGELEPEHVRQGVCAAVGWMATMANMDSLVQVREGLVTLKEMVELRLSSSIMHAQGWVEISSPYPVTPAIYDALGRKVKTLAGVPASLAAVRIPLEVSDLPSGVYWIAAQDEENLVTERFVLVR